MDWEALHDNVARGEVGLSAVAATGVRTGRVTMFAETAPGFDQQVEGFLRATDIAGRSGLITLIHCEDYAMIAHATERLIAEGGSPQLVKTAYLDDRTCAAIAAYAASLRATTTAVPALRPVPAAA